MPLTPLRSTYIFFFLLLLSSSSSSFLDDPYSVSMRSKGEFGGLKAMKSEMFPKWRMKKENRWRYVIPC